METNYYTVTPGGERRHLGKSSSGWKFLFYAPVSSAPREYAYAIGAWEDDGGALSSQDEDAS